jgi:predicted nuclease of predicted toxin-antitoxin system
MASIRLYLDEDVRPLLAHTLLMRGYDAVSALDLGRFALPDAQHFRYAAQEGRALLTFNIRDFVPLASKAMADGSTFPGLVVSEQLDFRELLRRTLRLLGSRSAADIANTIVWLGDFRSR